MQQLKLTNDLFAAFEDGGKRCTIRLGRRDIQLGDLEFESTEALDGKFLKQSVFVTRVVYTKAADITDQEAHDDGFKGTVDLVRGMKRFYPDMNFQTEVTLIYFDVI